MLRISVIIKNTAIDLPPVAPEALGGSITDYGNLGTSIIHFFHLKDGTSNIVRLIEGTTIEIGLIRKTIPTKKMEEIKILQQGERFELPFLSKYGKGLLVFTNS
jgi:hypothetical protein